MLNLICKQIVKIICCTISWNQIWFFFIFLFWGRFCQFWILKTWTLKSFLVNTNLHYSLPSKYFKGHMSYAQVGFFILCLNEWYSISALVHKVTYSRLCIGFWKKLLFVCNLMIVLGFGLSEIATCLTIPRVWYYNH